MQILTKNDEIFTQRSTIHNRFVIVNHMYCT